MSRGPKWFMAKRGRKDANHASIRDALRKLGHFVVDTSACGDGVLDLLVYDRLNNAVWLEVKSPDGKLRISQLEFISKLDARGIHHAVARTLDEALEAIR